MKNIIKGLVAGAMILSMSTAVLAQEKGSDETNHPLNIQEVDMTSGQKVDDVWTAMKWLGRHIKAGTVKGVKFVYRDGLKPIGIEAKDLAQLTARGSVEVLLTMKDGIVTVDHVIVNSSEKVYAKALRPYVVSPILAAGKLAIVDGSYKMIIRPVGSFLATTASSDVVTGVRAAGRSEADGAQALGSDASRDGQKVYEVILQPVGHGIAVGARATGNALATAGEATGNAIASGARVIYRGTLRGACEYARSFSDERMAQADDCKAPRTEMTKVKSED
jgi:hypothetical protein